MEGNFHNLYRMINRFLSEGYAVIYAIEAEGIGAPKNQFVNHTYSKIRQSGLIEGAEEYMQAGALQIMDAREIYSSDRIGNTAAMLEKWTSIIKELRRRKFKNIAIIAGGTTAFSNSDNQDSLVACEQTVLETAKKIGSVHVICCYLQESLDKLQFAHLTSIANAHQCNVTPDPSGMEYRKMNPSIMLDAIIEGIEDVMGEGSGRLIMQTMKAVYKIDEKTIISNPSLFQEKLQKMLGNTSKMILHSSKKKIKEIMLVVGVIVMIHSNIEPLFVISF